MVNRKRDWSKTREHIHETRTFNNNQTRTLTRIFAKTIRRALHYQEQITGEPLFKTTKRFFVFLMPGLASWIILIMIHQLLKEIYAPQVSYGIGIAMVFVFAFAFHRLVTFKIRSKWKTRFVKFACLILILSAVNWFLFLIGRSVYNLNIPDAALSFLITGFLSVINFLINRTFIFSHRDA